MKSRQSLPPDLELLKTAHPHDVPRIASMASLDDLEAAHEWASKALPGNSERRCAIRAELEKRKGGQP